MKVLILLLILLQLCCSSAHWTDIFRKSNKNDGVSQKEKKKPEEKKPGFWKRLRMRSAEKKQKKDFVSWLPEYGSDEQDGGASANQKKVTKPKSKQPRQPVEQRIRVSDQQNPTTKYIDEPQPPSKKKSKHSKRKQMIRDLASFDRWRKPSFSPFDFSSYHESDKTDAAAYMSTFFDPRPQTENRDENEFDDIALVQKNVQKENEGEEQTTTMSENGDEDEFDGWPDDEFDEFDDDEFDDEYIDGFKDGLEE